jgi:hypothetical protein
MSVAGWITPSFNVYRKRINLLTAGAQFHEELDSYQKLERGIELQSVYELIHVVEYQCNMRRVVYRRAELFQKYEDDQDRKERCPRPKSSSCYVGVSFKVPGSL